MAVIAQFIFELALLRSRNHCWDTGSRGAGTGWDGGNQLSPKGISPNSPRASLLHQPPGAGGTRVTTTQHGQATLSRVTGIPQPFLAGRDAPWCTAAGAPCRHSSYTSITTKFPTLLVSWHLLSIHFPAERLKWEYSVPPESIPLRGIRLTLLVSTWRDHAGASQQD